MTSPKFFTESNTHIPTLSVQETTGCGTQCPGLVDKVGISHRLDSMVLEIFSNLTGSVIFLNLFLKTPNAMVKTSRGIFSHSEEKAHS